MVKLHASLVALTLATTSALAFSRRSNLYSREAAAGRFQSRGFGNEEELVGRQPEPMRAFRYGFAVPNNIQSRGFEEELSERDLDAEEELFEREYDLEADLEAREPLNLAALGTMVKLANKARHTHSGKAMKIGKHVGKGIDQANNVQDFVSNFQSRGFEDDEELLFGRDLDAEELFVREYDLEAREPLSLSTLVKVTKGVHKAHSAKVMKIGKHVGKGIDQANNVQDFVSNFQSRGFEDDEELFGRDLDAEEFFGREYDDLD